MPRQAANAPAHGIALAVGQRRHRDQAAKLTTDGPKTYLTAVEGVFGAGVDYAMLDKIYANSHSRRRTDTL